MRGYTNKLFCYAKNLAVGFLNNKHTRSIKISTALIKNLYQFMSSENQKQGANALVITVGLSLIKKILKVQEIKWLHSMKEITSTENTELLNSFYIFSLILVSEYILIYFYKVNSNKVSIILYNQSTYYCADKVNELTAQEFVSLNQSVIRENITAVSTGVYNLSQLILDIFDNILGVAVTVIVNFNEKNQRYSLNEIIVIYWLITISLKLYGREKLYQMEQNEFDKNTGVKRYIDGMLQRNELIIMEDLRYSERKRLNTLLEQYYITNNIMNKEKLKINLLINLMYPIFLGLWLNNSENGPSKIMISLRIYNDLLGYINIINGNIFDFLPTARKIALIENIIKINSPTQNYIPPLMSASYSKLQIGNLEIRNISLSYQENFVLNQLSFKIPYGSTTFLVGENGSGKTSLLKILSGLYKPSSGYILNNGKNIWEDNIVGYRLNVSYCPQNYHTFLFEGSTQENIFYGAEHYEKKIEKNKYSGGEAQKLLLTKSILKNGALFIFDEANSEVDNKSRVKIFETIFEKTKGKTRIMVTHHLHEMQTFFKSADQILFLEKGTITASGRHDSLLQQCEAYNKLWTLPMI